MQHVQQPTAIDAKLRIPSQFRKLIRFGEKSSVSPHKYKRKITQHHRADEPRGRVLDQPTDGDLLDKVSTAGSGASFEELVRRHAGMVLGLCRRLLADAEDADDAAQAVFLVLWVKAGSLRRRSTVAGWLHRVAWHVCRNAKRGKIVRTTHERRAAESRQQSSDDNPPCHDPIQDVLDEEMERLPDKYRLPLVLFHLEGRSIEEITHSRGSGHRQSGLD